MATGGVTMVASIPQPLFYHFMLDGVRVKPCVRMTQRGKWGNPQALQYLNSKAELRALLGATMAREGWEMLPGQTPLSCYILVWFPAWLHRFDLDNVVKAVLDAANGVVYPDDRWIDSVYAHRMIGAARLEFGIGVSSPEHLSTHLLLLLRRKMARAARQRSGGLT